MKKKLTALVLVGVMLLSLLCCACQSSSTPSTPDTPDTSNTTDPSTQTPEESNAPAETEEIDMWKMPELTTVTTAKNIYDINIYPEGQTPDDNDLYDAMTEIMNIKFENVFAVPFEAYKQKIKMGMTTGSLPDMFTADEEDFAELVRNDALEDLTPYVEKYGSENLKHVLNYNDGAAMKPYLRDGKLYGIPNMSDALNSVPVLWIRADWLENLNREAPATTEEFLELAKAFAEEDPDGNGQKDTYGIALSKELDLRFTAFANLFGTYPKVYRSNGDGTYSYGSVDPAVKDVLTALADLYAAGAIDPEFATKDLTKMAETVSQGKVGMYIGEFFTPLWPLCDTVNLIEGADWIGVPMPGEDFVPYANINAMGAHVVRKGFANPEALIIYLNNRVESGYENQENAWSNAYAELSVTYANNGLNNWFPMLFDLPDANATGLALYKQADETGDTSVLPPNRKTTYELIQAAKNGDKAQWAWPKTYYEGVESALTYDTLIYTDWYLPPTETAKRVGTSLKDTEDTVFINIICGNQEPDAFDAFCADWAAQGGATILDEMAKEAAANS